MQFYFKASPHMDVSVSVHVARRNLKPQGYVQPTKESSDIYLTCVKSRYLLIPSFFLV